MPLGQGSQLMWSCVRQSPQLQFAVPTLSHYTSLLRVQVHKSSARRLGADERRSSVMQSQSLAGYSHLSGIGLCVVRQSPPVCQSLHAHFSLKKGVRCPTKTVTKDGGAKSRQRGPLTGTGKEGSDEERRLVSMRRKTIA